ncbi:MAG: hypothetical protein P4L45_11730 [Ignavibacteriaceae bacterium]|nr:hypothetical protein [Ignavibacteriaceae bacterium]
MKLKHGLISVLLLSILLLCNSLSAGQKKHTGLKAYLILKNTSTIIKTDSLFEKDLRVKLSKLLKKNNIILVSNEVMETPEQPHLYIYINISDSLRISADKKGSEGNSSIIIVPQKEKSYAYKNGQDIIQKVVSYAKENILKH